MIEQVMGVDMAKAKLLEEMTLNAWPSLQQVVDDGWLLRFANGYTRRANSVSSLYAGDDALDAKIARCEAQYADKGLPVIFKVSPASNPQHLDDALTERGYKVQATTSVQTLCLKEMVQPVAGNIRMQNSVTEEWLCAYERINSVAIEKRGIHRRIIDSIALPKIFVHALQDDLPVACGLGVLDRQYIGFYDIATDPAHRRKGYAQQVMNSMMGWARKYGAADAYLLVMADNQPALHLYAKLGFHHRYNYWYRVKQSKGAS